MLTASEFKRYAKAEIKVMVDHSGTTVFIPRDAAITVTVEDKRRDCIRELFEYMAEHADE